MYTVAERLDKNTPENAIGIFDFITELRLPLFIPVMEANEINIVE